MSIAPAKACSGWRMKHKKPIYACWWQMYASWTGGPARLGVPVLKAFAYPYGFVEPLADAVLRGQGYEATMTSEPHVNRLSRDPNCLYRMGRFNRSGLVDTETVIGWLTE